MTRRAPPLAHPTPSEYAEFRAKSRDLLYPAAQLLTSSSSHIAVEQPEMADFVTSEMSAIGRQVMRGETILSKCTLATAARLISSLSLRVDECLASVRRM